MAVFDKNVTESGKITHRARVRLKGHPPLSKTFDRLSDARRWAHKTETEIRSGRAFSRFEAEKHTIAELIDRYLVDVSHKKSPAMQKIGLVHLHWWLKKIGAYFLSDLSTAMIIE